MVISQIGELELHGTEGAFVLAAILGVFSAVQLGLLAGSVSAVLVILSLFAHEIGHLAMARFLGVRVRAIGICFRGAYLRRAEASQSHQELLISLSGPVASLLLYYYLRNGIPLVRWVAILNLVLAISNLVPLRGTDGHRALNALRRMSSHSEERGDSSISALNPHLK